MTTYPVLTFELISSIMTTYEVPEPNGHTYLTHSNTSVYSDSLFGKGAIIFPK